MSKEWMEAFGGGKGNMNFCIAEYLYGGVVV